MSEKEIAEQSMMWAREFARRLSLARHMIDDLAQVAAITILRWSATGYKSGTQSLKSYAKPLVMKEMRRHLNTMGGPVGYTESMPASVALINPEAEEGTVGQRDERTVPALSHESAEFNEALGRADVRVQLMIEAKLKGATYDEIADGLGVSREFVRRRVTAFATELAGVAA